MESGEKGKYLIIVALIGAAATISVPLIPRLFPEKGHASSSSSPVPNSGTSVQATQVAPNPNPSSASKAIVSARTDAKTAASIPPPERPQKRVDVAEDVALAREYAGMRKTEEATEAMQRVVAKAPNNGEFRVCLGSLDIQTGKVDDAEIQFRKASELGIEGMAAVVARLKANRETLIAAAKFHRDGDLDEDDWRIYQAIERAPIPGTENIRSDMHDALYKMVVNMSGSNPSFNRWSGREQGSMISMPHRSICPQQ